MKLTTDTELAVLLGITVQDVRDNCPRDGSGWPHLRPKRSVWRFTDDQVTRILALVAVRPAKKQPAAASVVGGQTSRSQKRSA